MQKFFLIRHGETDWNVAGKIQGHTDIPLNATGHLQAQERASTLQDVVFDACYSSDLARAEQTAQPFMEGRSIPFYKDMRLRERYHGTLEGMHWQAYHAMCPKERERVVESPENVVQRLFSVFSEIPLTQVLIVTHGGVMKALLQRLLPESQEIFVRNGALLQMGWIQGTPHLLSHDGVRFS